MRHSRTQVCVDGVPVFRGFDIIKSCNCYFTVNDKQSFINMIFYPLPFTNIVFIGSCANLVTKQVKRH